MSLLLCVVAMHLYALLAFCTVTLNLGFSKKKRKLNNLRRHRDIYEILSFANVKTLKNTATAPAPPHGRYVAA